MAVERIEEFIGVLKQARSEETIAGLCKDELRYLDGELALLSKRKSITNYRNAIRAIDPDHIALKYFKFGYQEYRSYRAGYRKQVAQDQRNLRPLDGETMILKAEELLDSDSYMTLALGLMLLSGRRSTEILKTANFEKVDENHLLFSGQLKTKGSDNAQTSPYVIPILCDADTFLSAFVQLRLLKDFSDVPNDKVSTNTTKNMGVICRKYFSSILPDVKPKDLRAAYATIAESIYKPSNMSQSAFFAQVLGHSADDVQTAQSYVDFYLTDS